MSAILNILQDDKELIVFRPSLMPIGENLIGVMILSQMIYWDSKSDGEEFRKMIEPSKNKKEGDRKSWTEELFISAHQFRTHVEVLERKKIISKRFDGRDTWWKINRKILAKELEKIYGKFDLEDKKNLEKENRELKKELKIIKKQLQDKTTTLPPAPKEDTPIAPLPTPIIVDDREEEIEKDLEDIEDLKSNYIDLSIKDIVKECDRMGIERDVARRFFSHYEPTGWKRGGSQILDWRPLLRGWKLTDEERVKSSNVYSPRELKRFFRRADITKLSKIEIDVGGEKLGVSSGGNIIYLDERGVHPQSNMILKYFLDNGLDVFIEKLDLRGV